MLKELLSELNISSNEAARRLGISHSGLSRILNEDRDPAAPTLQAIMHNLTDDPEIREKLLYAHLSDELNRAGMSDVKIRLAKRKFSKDTMEIEKMLETLSKASVAAEEIKKLVATVVGLIKQREK